jgi:hypothetical protein
MVRAQFTGDWPFGYGIWADWLKVIDAGSAGK